MATNKSPAHRTNRRIWVLVALAITGIAIAVVAWLLSTGDDHPRQARIEEITTAATATTTTTTAASGPVQTVPPSPSATTTARNTTTTISSPVSGPGREEVVTEFGPITIAEPSHADSYDRDLFGSGWIDADGDCQDTRAEVLITESQGPVTFTSPSNCTVAAGHWIDPWSGAENTAARALDVDHTVPLANAWRSGAWAWTPQQRFTFANDLTFADHLIAIPLGDNRSKGDAGPESWRPPNPAAWCLYARDWTAIKARWNLTVDRDEWAALTEMAASC